MSFIHEQRRYYRIFDEIIIAYRVFTSNELADLQAQGHTVENPVTDPDERLQLLWGDSHWVNYLGLATRPRLVIEPTISHYQGVTQVANLSVGGLAFATNRHIAVNSYLVFEITILPACYQIKALATVIACELSSLTPTFILRVRFDAMSAKDQRILSNHIDDKLLEKLRDDRGASNNSQQLFL